MSLWLVESPTWLASVGAGYHAAKAIDYIAKFNGKEPLKASFVKADEFADAEEDEKKEE